MTARVAAAARSSRRGGSNQRDINVATRASQAPYSAAERASRLDDELSSHRSTDGSSIPLAGGKQSARESASRWRQHRQTLHGLQRRHSQVRGDVAPPRRITAEGRDSRVRFLNGRPWPRPPVGRRVQRRGLACSAPGPSRPGPRPPSTKPWPWQAGQTPACTRPSASTARADTWMQTTPLPPRAPSWLRGPGPARGPC